MQYMEILGHKTWVSVSDNDREPLLLLHGGRTSTTTMLPVGNLLDPKYRVSAFDRRGHGRTADSPEPFHYHTMADETIAVLEAIGGPSHIVGWSDGGNIGLIVAMRRPDLVKRLVVIGSNFHHDGFSGGSVTDDVRKTLFADYVDCSPDGPDHWGVVGEKTGTMWGSEPTLEIADLSTISVPVLVLVGDDDMIKLSHTVALYENIAGAQLAVVPGASHAVVLEYPEKVAKIVDDFLTQQLPVVTMMHTRRAAPVTPTLE